LVLTYGNMMVERDGGPPVVWHSDFGPRHKFQPPTFSEHNLKRPDIPLVSSFFKRNAFEIVGGFKGEAGPVTDWMFWTEIGLIGPVLRIKEPLGLYRVHGKNETLSAKNSYITTLQMSMLNLCTQTSLKITPCHTLKRLL
jgi:hypothetical protein